MRYYSVLIFLLIHISAYSQNLLDSCQYMEIGGKYVINFDKKGSKSLIAECFDTSFSDSTEYQCNKNYSIKLSAIGKDIPLGSHGSYKPGLSVQGIDQSFGSRGTTYNYDFKLPVPNQTLKVGSIN